MKVLVIGGGGREHALVWKINQSPLVHEVFCAPGNAGIARLATCLDIGSTDLNRLAEAVVREKIDLTVVGPELPLTMGITDHFEREGLRIFGVNQRASILEGSKSFAKDLMKKYGIPTGFHRTFTDREEAVDYVEEVGCPVVVKADGLAAGKGVSICTTLDEARQVLIEFMDERIFGSAGEQVVIEEFLEGEEASFIAFTDGRTVLPMASSQDHKRVFDHDEGPNTGGMGAYSPAPVVTPERHEMITREIMLPVVEAMAAEERPYRGVLYAGLMFTSTGPKVLEFNVRLGDPETQPILMRLNGDIVPVLQACIEGRLHEQELTWYQDPAVCVIMASHGYPRTYEKGKRILGLEAAATLEGVQVFHAGTRDIGGQTVTAGGRVLGVTARAPSIEAAIRRAYEAASVISFDGAHYRRDIGQRALDRQEES